MRLKLTSAHGAAIIEAAVRAGYQPTRNDKESVTRWTFLPEARRGGRSRDHRSDPGNPCGTSSYTNAEGFRCRFSIFKKIDDRLVEQARDLELAPKLGTLNLR